jgi:hypothetical protein
MEKAKRGDLIGISFPHKEFCTRRFKQMSSETKADFESSLLGTTSSDSSASGDETIPDSVNRFSLDSIANLSELFEPEKAYSSHPLFYHVRPTLFEHCSWRVSCAGDVLDRRLAASRSMRTREVELVTNTLIFCFCRGMVKFILIVIGIYLLLSCFFSAKYLLDGFYPHAQISTVRVFQPLHLPNMNLSADSFDLHQACIDIPHYSDLYLPERPVSILGFTVQLNRTNGFESQKYFFQIEGSKDDGKTFTIIGASAMRWTLTGIRFIDSGVDILHDLRLPWRANLAYDYHFPWPHHLGQDSIPILLLAASATLSTGVLAIFRHHEAAKRVTLGALLLFSAAFLVSAVGFVSLGLYRSAFHPSCCCAGCAALAVGLALHDRLTANTALRT